MLEVMSMQKGKDRGQRFQFTYGDEMTHKA